MWVGGYLGVFHKIAASRAADANWAWIESKVTQPLTLDY